MYFLDDENISGLHETCTKALFVCLLLIYQ